VFRAGIEALLSLLGAEAVMQIAPVAPLHSWVGAGAGAGAAASLVLPHHRTPV
jgi:hypothetical protein